MACASFAFGQGVRFGDNYPVSSSLTNPGVISTVSGSLINICVFPANAVPCTNKATTYTSNTLGTPCSTSIQLVLAGTNVCVGTTDLRGNWGAWVPPGTYDFTITVSTGQSYGPFTVSAGNTSSASLTGPGSISGTFSGSPILTALWTFNAGLSSIGITLLPIAAGNNQASSVLAFQSTNSIGGHPQTLMSEDALGDFNITDSLFNGNVVVTPGTNGAIYTFSFNGANANVTQTIGSGTVTTAGTIINTGTSQAQAGITITSALATDTASCALNAAPVATWQTGIQMLPPVVTANTVTVWLSNPTAGNITPAATVVRCTVTR